MSDWLTVHIGDCRDVLPTLPAESVHCVVTSPPYWGLRDYGVDGQTGLEPTPDEYLATMVGEPTAPRTRDFATFPEALVEPCIKAGTSERGVCPECGAPWVRVVEVRPEYQAWAKTQRFYGDGNQGSGFRQAGTNSAVAPPKSTTIGWQPSCSHDAEPVPAIVLDPFAGSGTVGLVANRLSRRAVLIELSADYACQIDRRTAQAPLGLR